MLIWRILNKALPLRSELEKRGIQCSPLCPRCNAKLETSTHTFMTCPMINRTWFGSNLNLKILNQPISDFSDWLNHIIQNEKDDTTIQVAVITYYIWFARNLSIFESRILPEIEIIKRALASVSDYQAAIHQHTEPDLHTSSSHHIQKIPRTTRWVRPAEGSVKVNSNANLQEQG